MANDYTDYLAVHVLNEQQLVSYRSLGRALKVHSNLAKQMLFEFHRKQNAKRPGSVHATYVITGTTTNAAPSPTTNGVHVHIQRDEDSLMQSSPPLPGSSAPEFADQLDEPLVATKAMILVREEHLDKARLRFDSVTSVHIYSLEAKGVSDMQTLRDCNRQIFSTYASEDPLKDWQKYGTIQNPSAKRRVGRGGPPLAPAPAPAVIPKPQANVTNNASSSIRPNEGSAEKAASTSATSKPTATSKHDTSSIFKSFAKAKPPNKKKAAEQPKPKDEPMADFSDEDETEDSALPETSGDDKAPTGKSKKEREAELAAMMDQEDEPMEDEPKDVELKEDESMEDAAETSAPAEPDENTDDYIDSQPAPAPEPKEAVTVENGRRRGRRKIMKKKTVKDEDGYLVTREEPAWESFSEEEPAPKRAKATPVAAGAAGKKSTAKPGQGNIMKFFGKK